MDIPKKTEKRNRLETFLYGGGDTNIDRRRGTSGNEGSGVPFLRLLWLEPRETSICI